MSIRMNPFSQELVDMANYFVDKYNLDRSKSMAEIRALPERGSEFEPIEESSCISIRNINFNKHSIVNGFHNAIDWIRGNSNSSAKRFIQLSLQEPYGSFPTNKDIRE